MDTINLRKYSCSYTSCTSIAIILLILFISPGNADDLKTILGNDFDLILSASNSRSTNSEVIHKSKNEVTPVSFVAFGLITVYQKVISSQDRTICNFRPSCSHFTFEAINQNGFLKGSLMAADRILRCHPYSLDLYEKSSKSWEAYDPVEKYMDVD